MWLTHKDARAFKIESQPIEAVVHFTCLGAMVASHVEESRVSKSDLARPGYKKAKVVD